MKKHVVLTVALLLLAFVLAGCVSDNDIGGKNTSASSTEKTTVSDSVETTEDTTAKAPATTTQTQSGDGYTKRY
ncbi:MAG: hypothetical protein E7670_06290 [Ruminococcaceae bacterium]|nr:hypothetical protein [Oscillospiraceae bacterium]